METKNISQEVELTEMSDEINTIIRSVKDIKYKTIYGTSTKTKQKIDFQSNFFNKLFSF